tara:strand:- start:64 stop:501 length:438 start_codon:yes stop_codon:yes gene_type:complete
MTKYYQGKYSPKNPIKYKGDPTNIVFRSSWELKAMKYFDLNENVLKWQSEELAVPYKSPIDGRWHRYFPDFLIEVRTKEKLIETHMVEVKPYAQTMEPKVKSRKTKRYITEVKNWGINSYKWKYARSFCEKRKWKFTIVTEKDLF